MSRKSQGDDRTNPPDLLSYANDCDAKDRIAMDEYKASMESPSVAPAPVQPIFFGPPKPPKRAKHTHEKPSTPSQSSAWPESSGPRDQDPRPDSAYLRHATIREAAVACTGNTTGYCPNCRDESCDVCKAYGKYWFEVSSMAQVERLANEAALMAKVFRNVGATCSCSDDVIATRIHAMISNDWYPRDIDEYIISCREVGCPADGRVHKAFHDRPRPRNEERIHDPRLCHGKIFFIRSCCVDEHDMKLIGGSEDIHELGFHAMLVDKAVSDPLFRQALAEKVWD